MLRISKLIAVLAVGLMGLMWAVPASAQATRTWISGVGDDVNPCSRTAPCKTFAGAISKTAAGGEIDTLDPGGFGAVTVTKSITLANEGAGEAGILVAGTNGITVNLASCPSQSPADAACVVVIRGLVLDGGPTGSNSLSGVKVVKAAEVIVENCTIRNFNGGSPNGYGIFVNPSAGPTRLEVINSTISSNGQLGSGYGGGIQLAPTGSATVAAMLDNVRIEGNQNGVVLDTTQSTGGTSSVIIRASDINGGAAVVGVTSSSNAGQGIAMLTNTTISNGTFGIVSGGTGAQVFVGGSTIFRNGTGLFKSGAGAIVSYGNNQINGNTADGYANIAATIGLH